ncbi:MAG: LytTR family DNA-binding domain-containing protein [Gemmatimonadaceae bacterium]|jgi:two-component system LytT family response regulator|nr:LytTR family DNA-binding domain-containing protein [Gemmatimonadaceae bacterium]
MAPLRVLIVDDEAPARRRLRHLLERIDGVTIAGEAVDGEDAVLQIGRLTPDLVLLDIRLPQLDGFGVIASVGRALMPDVIFTTAFDAHAVRAFEVRALDYLLKPIDPVRLAEACARAIERHAQVRSAEERARRDGLHAGVREVGAAPRRVLAHAADRSAALVLLEEVVLVRAQRNYVTLHTPAGVFRMRETLREFHARLDPSRFLQVNRSDIVRLDAIERLERWTHGEYRITLPGAPALLWSRRFRARDAERFALPAPDDPTP